MGLLDRLVSGMIQRETGFNPRRLVRMVGGRRIMMLGGAALAGGLMAQAGAQKQTTRTAPAPPSTPPDLPPLPIDESVEQDLPPVPRGEAAKPGGEAVQTGGQADPVPQDLLYAIVRTMVSAALADGELDSEEKKLIDDQLSGSELDEQQIAQVRRDLIVPASVEELADLLPEGEDPEVLARFGVLIARADGQQSEEETAWLESLVGALDMAPGSVERLTSEIFEQDDASGL